MNAKTIILSAAGFGVAACAHAEAPDTTSSAASSAAMSDLEILQSFAADYERDVTFKNAATFGVEVGGEFYTVNATPASDGTKASVIVRAGAPNAPTFYYFVENNEHLNKVANGELNVLTSMAKAFSSDYAPMDIETQEGFEPPEDFIATLLPLTFHFWTKGNPELIPFGPDMTRQTHGSNAGIFYYQPGFRSGWFNILPGEHVNEDEKSRDNPFPSLFIMVRGEVTALIGDEEMTFTEGNAMLVPAGVSHQFINNGDEPAFGFLFMFGDGA